MALIYDIVVSQKHQTGTLTQLNLSQELTPIYHLHDGTLQHCTHYGAIKNLVLAEWMISWSWNPMKAISAVPLHRVQSKYMYGTTTYANIWLIDDLMQRRRNSSALAIGLRLFCIKLSISGYNCKRHRSNADVNPLQRWTEDRNVFCSQSFLIWEYTGIHICTYHCMLKLLI